MIVTLLDTVPPSPAHSRVNIVVACSGAVDSEPLAPRTPVQPPLPVQDAAFVDDHASVEMPPGASESGLAVRISVGSGGGFAVTVTLFEIVPPLPVQASVKVVVVASAPVDSVPLVDFVSLQPPLAMQLVAFVDDQLSIEGSPVVTESGLAVSVKVGAGYETVTVAVRETVPPSPVQVSVKEVVVARGPVVSVPLAGRGPLQPPLAVQEVAYFVDQLSFETAPGGTDAGFTLKYATRGLQPVQEVVSAAMTRCANTASTAIAASESAIAPDAVVFERAFTITFPIFKTRQGMRARPPCAMSLKAEAARRQLEKYRRTYVTHSPLRWMEPATLCTTLDRVQRRSTRQMSEILTIQSTLKNCSSPNSTTAGCAADAVGSPSRCAHSRACARHAA